MDDHTPNVLLKICEENVDVIDTDIIHDNDSDVKIDDDSDDDDDSSDEDDDADEVIDIQHISEVKNYDNMNLKENTDEIISVIKKGKIRKQFGNQLKTKWHKKENQEKETDLQ